MPMGSSGWRGHSMGLSSRSKPCRVGYGAVRTEVHTGP